MKRLKTTFAAALILALAACQPSAPVSFHATDVTGAAFAPDFRLKDVTGTARTLSEFQGKVVLLFFGYTNCPDFCPGTLVKLKGVMQDLGEEATKVQVLFVTVDPARDTADVLARYVPAFHPAFIGLRPDPADLPGLAQGFKMVVDQHGSHAAAPGQYDVGHSTHVYAYDPAGRIRLLMDSGQKQADIVADIRSLLKAAN